MSFRSILILLLGVVTVLFVGANWTLISQPATLSLLVMTVEAPLGIVLLGLLALFVLVFVVYIGYLQTTVLVESRRHAKELAAQRVLADKAEASRFFELKTHLDGAFSLITRQLEQEFKGLGGKVDGAESRLGDKVDEQANSLAASIGAAKPELPLRTRSDGTLGL